MKKRFVLLCVILLGSPLANAGQPGVPAAKRVDIMLERLGGRALWAESRSLFLLERARHGSYGEGIVTNAWIDLETPGEAISFKHERLNLEHHWNEKSGWISRQGDVRDMGALELEEKTAQWSRDMLVVLHRLASSDPSLKVEPSGVHDLVVKDAGGEKIAMVKLTPGGEVYYWSELGAGEPMTMLFGPYRHFGQAVFPEWAITSNGEWTWHFVQISPNAQPMASNVHMKRPGNSWGGGALVREDCEP